MGNSLLDIIVFGRNAGQQAGAKCKNVSTGKPTLAHVGKFEQERSAAGIAGAAVSPMLLPDYVRKVERGA
jgi:succinate dehydrogenase / fumarate reductase flavoprotein subunit